MKNITISVDEETYRRARANAAEAGTSVSALVREFLVAFVQEHSQEDVFDQMRRLQDQTLRSIQSRGAGLRGADNVDRDTLHGRDGLR